MQAICNSRRQMEYPPNHVRYLCDTPEIITTPCGHPPTTTDGESEHCRNKIRPRRPRVAPRHSAHAGLVVRSHGSAMPQAVNYATRRACGLASEYICASPAENEQAQLAHGSIQGSIGKGGAGEAGRESHQASVFQVPRHRALPGERVVSPPTAPAHCDSHSGVGSPSLPVRPVD